MAVAMTSYRRWSTRFVLLLMLVVLDGGSTLALSMTHPNDADAAPVTRPTKRRVARVSGDILIGALFPVHRQPSMKTAYTRQCGEVRPMACNIFDFYYPAILSEAGIVFGSVRRQLSSYPKIKIRKYVLRSKTRVNGHGEMSLKCIQL